MEYVSERERFENRLVPHDALPTEAQLAIQALIDRFETKEGNDDE